MNGKLWGGLAALLVLVALVGVAPFLPDDNGSQLSAYDDGPFGLSSARDTLEGTGGAEAPWWKVWDQGKRGSGDGAGFVTRNVGSSPLVLRDIDANSTLLVIAGVERPYTPSEADALDAFMRDGGAILLLDDYGFGEEYTSRHGIEFLHRPLLDKNFLQNQSFVRVGAQLGGQTYDLLLNSPSGLRDVDRNDTKLTPFMVSSNASYLDLDQDDRITVFDKTGPFNVGLRREVGAGTLYVIADSGLAVNDMVDRQDNARFLAALAAQELPPGGLVLFDESKRGLAPSEMAVLSTERATLGIYRNIPALGLTVLGAVSLLALLALLRLPGREFWVHRFTPAKYVPPNVARSKRDLVVGILEAKRALDVGSGLSDPVVESALRDPDALRDDDLPRLLEHVRSAMDLELPPGESTSN